MNFTTARLSLALAAALAAGCAVPEWQTLGTPQAEVERAMGRPTLTVPLAGGGERLLYSRQPSGQQVYHMDFDAQHRLTRVTQALTPQAFESLSAGQDTREGVMQRFGPPALVERVASFDGDVWTYRILDNTIQRRAHVHIDRAGVVRYVMFTDEPTYDHDQSR